MDSTRLLTITLIAFLLLPLLSGVYMRADASRNIERRVMLEKAKVATVLVITIVHCHIVWEEFMNDLQAVGMDPAPYVETVFFGSGFLVSPDGYIITNGHVVNEFESELERILPLLQQFVIDFVDAATKRGYQLTDEQVRNLFQQAVSAYLKGDLQIREYGVDVRVGMGKVVAGIGNIGKLYTARIVEAKPFEREDLALLKIEVSHAPSLIVSPKKIVDTGDHVWAVGYPGAVTFHQLLSEETLMEPTVTEGMVSGYREKTGGVEVLQADVAVSHGNSGGPLINDEGIVVAVTSFGSVDPTGSGREVPGFNFFVPSPLVYEMLSRNGVDNRQDIVMKLYEEGLRLFYGKHYSAALEKFNQIRDLHPGFPYIDYYISESRAAIARGEDVPVEQPGLSSMTMLLIVVAAAVVAGGAGGYLYLKKKRIQPQSREPVVPVQETPYMLPQAPATPQHQNQQIVQAVKYCWNCGRAIPADARICPYCGKPQEEV